MLKCLNSLRFCAATLQTWTDSGKCLQDLKPRLRAAITTSQKYVWMTQWCALMSNLCECEKQSSVIVYCNRNFMRAIFKTLPCNSAENLNTIHSKTIVCLSCLFKHTFPTAVHTVGDLFCTHLQPFWSFGCTLGITPVIIITIVTSFVSVL